jgi:hypothetical protein
MNEPLPKLLPVVRPGGDAIIKHAIFQARQGAKGKSGNRPFSCSYIQSY